MRRQQIPESLLLPALANKELFFDFENAKGEDMVHLWETGLNLQSFSGTWAPIKPTKQVLCLLISVQSLQASSRLHYWLLASTGVKVIWARHIW